MTDDSLEDTSRTTPTWRSSAMRPIVLSSVILAASIVIGGFALGDGLKRAQRGLAERDVTADLATWTISYSASASDLSSAQASVDQDTKQIHAFFRELGFPDDALQPTGVNVSQYKDNGVPNFTVRQRITLRTNDIKRAEDAVRRQFDLVRRGVILEEGSGMSYTFTKLNDIKPEMVAAATKDARAAAEQFAKDSGAEVGAIKNATQGYFSIDARDGDSGGWGVSDSPFKKVRVVTTVNFYLR
mgnify:CR=1 FL=1